ncbi:uncharacterized protein BJX67DRAFT_130577 [Aspergillus lucknowensis]|uniref:Uncharacterized protein n=1 Tax=Aspergillus lucknowensis TaxID=176173 RepID=A0ABR4LPU0_9EURO
MGRIRMKKKKKKGVKLSKSSGWVGVERKGRNKKQTNCLGLEPCCAHATPPFDFPRMQPQSSMSKVAFSPWLQTCSFMITNFQYAHGRDARTLEAIGQENRVQVPNSSFPAGSSRPGSLHPEMTRFSSLDSGKPVTKSAFSLFFSKEWGTTSRESCDLEGAHMSLLPTFHFWLKRHAGGNKTPSRRTQVATASAIAAGSPF